MKRFVIGLCGGTGSGKTTLAKNIHQALGEKSVLVSMDSYYKTHPELCYEERTKINYDHPDAFDKELMLSQLRDLKAGKAVKCPVYDYAAHLRSDEVTDIPSTPVIIFEGILLFAIPEVVDELDMKIFVDTDADVRILRRILRDVKKRGRSIDSVVTQYLTTVKPMHETYIEPFKKVADIIVPEGGKNTVAYEMIVSDLLRKVKAIEKEQEMEEV